MSKENKNPFLNEKKKKRHLWGLWIPLMIIGGIIIIPLAFAMIFFFDPGHYDTGVKEAVEPQALLDNMVGGLLDDCRAETGQAMSINIDQSLINQVLITLSNSVNNTVGGFTNGIVNVSQFDIQILENKRYIFEAEASGLTIFKTRAVLTLEIDGEAEVPTSSGIQKGLVIRIVDAKVGRLDGLLNAVSSFVNIGKILNDLKTQQGLNFTYNADTNTISYSYLQAIDDLMAKINTGSGSGSGSDQSMIKLLKDLLGVFIKQNLFHFPHTVGKINATIPLDDFKQNSTFYSDALTIREKETYEGQQMLMLTAKAKYIDKLLNEGIITEQYAQTYNLKLDKACLAVHKFLAFGKDFISATNELPYVTSLYNSSTVFKAMLDNMSIDDYSTLRRLAYFGPSDTSFVDAIKEKASAKVTNMVENSQDYIAGYKIEDLTEADLEQMVLDGLIDEIPDPEDSKKVALFNNIKSKIDTGGWYLFGGDYTTYYFDNNLANWQRVYAYCENSVTGEAEVADLQGVRMIHVGNNVWSYDIPSEFDTVTFLDKLDNHHTTGQLTLNPNARYYNVSGEWVTVPSTIVEFENQIKIYDSNIHNLVKDNTGILGFGFPLIGKDLQGKYKYSYMLLDNIYPTTKTIGDKSYFALTFGLNINGTETQLVLPCEQDTTYSPTEPYVFGIRFDMSNAVMCYGDTAVPEVKSILDDLISRASFSSSFISFDNQKMTIKVDLNSLVSSGHFQELNQKLNEYDASLFVNLIPVNNPTSEQAEKGRGGFEVKVGYKKNA